MIVKQITFLYVWCNFTIAMYIPSENGMHWLFVTNKIILSFFFFFSLQQHFTIEDELLVRMRDNYFIKSFLYITLE